MGRYESKKSIEDFKSNLANGGVRPTMFEVQIVFPKSIAGASDISAGGTNPLAPSFESVPAGERPGQPELTEKSTFMVKAATLPGSNIGEIAVPFRGRRLKVSGDRTFNNWQTTIFNDSDYRLRDAIEKWSETIQYHNFALGHNQLVDGVYNPTEFLAGNEDGYMGTGIVRQLDRQGRQLKLYQFAGIWPITIDDINLDFGVNDTIEEYGVTWAVQYWHAAGASSENGPNYTGPSNPNEDRRIIKS